MECNKCEIEPVVSVTTYAVIMNDWKIQGFFKTDKSSRSAHHLVPIGDGFCLFHSVSKINEENIPPATWRTVQAF